MNFRPVFIAATAVVPLPMKPSKITPPRFRTFNNTLFNKFQGLLVLMQLSGTAYPFKCPNIRQASALQRPSSFVQIQNWFIFSAVCSQQIPCRMVVLNPDYGILDLESRFNAPPPEQVYRFVGAEQIHGRIIFQYSKTFLYISPDEFRIPIPANFMAELMHLVLPESRLISDQIRWIRNDKIDALIGYLHHAFKTVIIVYFV